MQGTLLLWGQYCDTLHNQLAAQEEKSKRRNKRKIAGDGLPQLLTGDDFITKVQDHKEEQQRQVAQLQAQKASREVRGEAMKEWKKADREQKMQNEEIKARFKEEMEEWEAECDRAKHKKQKPSWKKPTRQKLTPPIPKQPKTIPDLEDGNNDDRGPEDSSSDDDDNNE